MTTVNEIPQTLPQQQGRKKYLPQNTVLKHCKKSNISHYLPRDKNLITRNRKSVWQFLEASSHFACVI